MRFLDKIRRRRRPSSVLLAQTPGTGASSERTPFGFKTGWLAIRSDDLHHVADKLLSTRQQEVGWGAGVGAAYAAGVFVCPPVDGWILVMGSEVLTTEVDPAEFSRRLGCEVQVFKTHRVVDLHAWARAVDGILIRSFEYVGESGEITVNLGEVSVAEEDEIRAADCAGLPVGPVPFDDVDLVVPTEETVMVIAHEWSLDPTQLEGTDERCGILGQLR